MIFVSSIPVLAPPRSAYFACLSLLTHLIQIISLLEVRSVHELCSDWHASYTGSTAPYTGSIAPYTGSIAPYTGSIAPYTVSIAPYTVSIAPYTGSIAPYTGSIAPHTGSIAPRTVSIAPHTVSVAPHTVSVAPHTGSVAPHTGSFAPHTGSIAPHTGSIAPYTGSIAPYTGSIAPYTGSIAPYTGSIAPYTGSIALYTGSIAPYSLSREIRWSLLYLGSSLETCFFKSWTCICLTCGALVRDASAAVIDVPKENVINMHFVWTAWFQFWRKHHHLGIDVLFLLPFIHLQFTSLHVNEVAPVVTAVICMLIKIWEGSSTISDQFLMMWSSQMVHNQHTCWISSL